ncbi:MAG: MFS transporter [Ardenticatenales bacterium]|nr:MFS transporter [Ardenticatenales bacterium]
MLRQNKAYVAVALTHFTVDVLNNSRTLLIAILALSLGLSNAQVALVALLYNVGSAVMQPLFGWLADRFGARWLVLGGIGWMILFYGLAALAGDWLALVALTVAGVGSGAFHPTGTMVASQASTTRRTQATAYFFTAGQLGLFLGPVFAGILLQLRGRPGVILLPLLALIVFLLDWRWLPPTAPPHGHDHASSTPARTRAAPRGFLALLLFVIIISANTVSISTLTFAPKLFTEAGYAAGYVGWLTGLFMLGSAVGGIVGGHLADRRGGKWPILLGMSAGILPAYFYIPNHGIVQLLLLLLAGFFVGMPHSVLVIQVQSMLPGRQALASGLTLGVMFFGGSVGSTVVGALADQVGLATALQRTAFVLFAALLAALLYPARKRAPVVVAASPPS